MTKVNIRTVKEAGEKINLFLRTQAATRASLATHSGPSAPRTHSFAARICCQKRQLELPAEEAIEKADTSLVVVILCFQLQ